MQKQDKILFYPDGVGIHVLLTNAGADRPTIAFLPGMSGTAEDGPLSLAPCLEHGVNLASMSFRGRGQSTTPSSGYTIDDHADDIGLFVKNIDSNQIFLVANSISTIYAAQYLLRKEANPVKGLVIVDHPLTVRKLREGWADDFAQLTIAGKPVLETMRKQAMEGIEAESIALDLYTAYGELELPTLVFSAPIGRGLLTDLDLTYYGGQKKTETVIFENSDHFIRLREPERYYAEILKFVIQLG